MNNKEESFSEEMERLLKESDERIQKMSPKEKKELEEASKRHARKARIEMQGYDQHPDEKKEDVFKGENEEE